jgi:hypothetical protein
MTAPTTSVFQDIISAYEIEQAALATLQMWLPTYLREVERQGGLPVNSLPDVRSYIGMTDNTQVLPGQLPALGVVSPGLASAPLKGGDGWYRASFSLGVVVLATALDRASASRNVRHYASAIRALMLQKRSLGGICSDMSWLDEDYTDTPTESEDTMGVVTLTFQAVVAGVTNINGGPSVPDPNPGNWPTVQVTDVEVDIVKEDLP